MSRLLQPWPRAARTSSWRGLSKMPLRSRQPPPSHHHYTPKLDDAEWVGIFRRLKALFSEAEAAAWVDRWERLAGAKRLDDAQNIMELVALGMGAKRRETPSEPRSRRS